MALGFEIKKRRVVPNWRDFKRTLKLNELRYTGIPKEINFNLSQQIYDWQHNKNIAVAADLVNSAFVSSITDNPEIDEAIGFILSNKESASKTLIELVQKINDIKILDESSSNSELEVETLEEFNSHIDNKVANKIINRTKTKAYNEVNNSIVWVELARLYSIFGQEEKAIRAMMTALQIAPNNRFVLRSATRLFVHYELFDKALYYLKRSESTKSDPWLISAHIATSSVIDRHSPFLKTGVSIIDSKNFSPYDLTELSSSIGTLEFTAGSFKKAKKYFDQSILGLNDNSLAQLEWISKEDNKFSFNPMLYQNVKNPFEAFALSEMEKGNFDKAFKESIKWFLDIPYSKRPILLGSYIASTFLKDEETSILLCQAGLKANPNDYLLLNNIVYSYALANKIEEGKFYIDAFSKIKLSLLSDENKTVFQATYGLLAFRSGEIEVGKKLYQRAIENASIINNDYFKNLAILNYTRELILNNCNERFDMLEKINKTPFPNEQKDLNILKEEVIKLSKTIIHLK